MPFIRVNCPNGALSSEQKATLAPRLVQALIRQEIDPVTRNRHGGNQFLLQRTRCRKLLPGRRSAIRASRQGVLDLVSRTSRLAAGAR